MKLPRLNLVQILPLSAALTGVVLLLFIVLSESTPQPISATVIPKQPSIPIVSERKPVSVYEPITNLEYVNPFLPISIPRLGTHFRYMGSSDPSNSWPILKDQVDRKGTVGRSLHINLGEARGGDRPLAYEVTGIPDGTDFHTTPRYHIRGVPERAGTYDVKYRVKDQDDDTFEIGFTLTIAEPIPVARETPKTQDRTAGRLAGVWSITGGGGGYVYLHRHGTARLLSINCALRASGRWKYESMILTIELPNGGGVIEHTVVSVPHNLQPGTNIEFDTGRRWMLVTTDTSAPC